MRLMSYIDKVKQGLDLSVSEAEQTLTIIMNGKALEEEIEDLLLSLSEKGEHVSELIGFAKAMRNHSIKIQLPVDDILDTCGTGGDGANIYNVSTAVAFVAASAGIPVAKHGNRAISSKSGSIDVLEALGIGLKIDQHKSKQLFKATNLLFMFAQQHHPAMRFVAPIRSKLKKRTIFNMLGPLTNPAGAKNQVIGVYSEQLTKKIGEALLQLQCQRGLVVHSSSGLDELSIDGKNIVTEIINQKLQTYHIFPEDVGLRTSNLSNISGGTAIENAEAILAIFKGKLGPDRDILVFNAGAALYAANKTNSIADGVRLAEQLIDSKAVYDKYNLYQKLSSQLQLEGAIS